MSRRKQEIATRERKAENNKRKWQRTLEKRAEQQTLADRRRAQSKREREEEEARLARRKAAAEEARKRALEAEAARQEERRRFEEQLARRLEAEGPVAASDVPLIEMFDTHSYVSGPNHLATLRIVALERTWLVAVPPWPTMIRHLDRGDLPTLSLCEVLAESKIPRVLVGDNPPPFVPGIMNWTISRRDCRTLTGAQMEQLYRTGAYIDERSEIRLIDPADAGAFLVEAPRRGTPVRGGMALTALLFAAALMGPNEG